MGIYNPCIVPTIVNPETLFMFGEIRYEFLLYQVSTKNGDSTIQIYYLKNENIKTLYCFGNFFSSLISWMKELKLNKFQWLMLSLSETQWHSADQWSMNFLYDLRQ